MRINSHAHIFNLRTIVTAETQEIVRRRIREEIEPDWLAEAASDLAIDIALGIARADEETHS